MLPELREILEELAGSGVVIHSEEDFWRALENRPNLREKLVRAMQGRQDGPAIPAEFQEHIQIVEELKQRYLQSGDLAALNLVVEAWQRILGQPSFAQAPEHFRLAVLNNTGGVCWRRYQHTGFMQDLDFALQCWQQVVEAAPLDSPDQPTILNNLGNGLSDRYARSGQLEDLEEAIRVYQQAVNATPPDSSDRPMYLTNLGAGLSDRYARSGRLEDLEEAIRVYQQAVDTTPPDSPNRAMYLNNMGAGLRAHYVRSGQMEDLEEAIRVYQQAVDATPLDSLNRPMYLSNLGNGLSSRYERSGRLEDLEEAIRVYQQAVDATPLDSPNRPMYLSNLGNGLSNRYECSGRLEDLEEAIRVYQQAVDTTPPDSPNRPMYLNNLGNGLSARYERSGRLEDLEEAIQVYQLAVDTTPPDSPNRPSHLNNLGGGLSDRYMRSGRLEDLEESIRIYQQAVDTTPPDSPARPGYLSNLGAGLSARYTRNGQLKDLEEAIQVWQEVVDATPPDSPDRPSHLNKLGAGLSERYACSGQLEDMEEAIRVFQQAVNATPLDSPHRPTYLNNLGNGLSARYARSGQLEDLEEAIQVYQQAVNATPPDSSDRPSHLSNLGSGLIDRYARGGRLEDLEEAIRVYQQAVNATPPDSPDRPSYLNNLGAGLIARYARSGQLEDLEEAIRVYQQAVDYTLPDSPDRPSRLNNLSSGLSARYARNGQLEDLEEAIRLQQQAVNITPQGSPAWPSRLNNLGAELGARYTRTGQLKDQEEAIRLQQQAVDYTLPDSPDRPKFLNNLGNVLRDRYAHNGRIEDLREAQDCYRTACVLGEQQALEIMLAAGRNWSHWAFERQAWKEAVEAFDCTYRAMERLFQAQFSRSGKTSWMGELRGIPSRAAYAHWKTGQPEKAVEALEAGRARLLGEALERQRRDLEQLPSLGHADLLERYRRATECYEALQRLGSDTFGHVAETTAQRPADWLAQMEVASAELDAVIADIQGVPGYETFLKTLTAGQIRAQASDLGAPLVYLAATPAGGLAFIVTKQGVQPVELPVLTKDSLQKLVSGEEGEVSYLRTYLDWRFDLYDSEKDKSWQQALDATCNWLGQAVMGPLVAALRESVPPEGQVILIPADRLSLLPLHAAKLPESDAGETETYALDHYAFTYAPSAQALYHAKEQTRSATVETLMAVEDPRGDLPYTPDEVKAVRAHFGERGRHLSGQEATREAVRAAIPAANVLHFSTHGLAGWGDAESARLLLADGDLTLREVYDLKLDQARLVLLSACETAVPGLENLDEMIALPSGWMQAGVPGVVGTLWAVNDLSTAMLIARFYDLWRQQGLPLPQALRQAQCWLRDLHRDEAALTELHSMAEQVRLRMPAQQARAFLPQALLRDFSHPYYWASFTFTGL